MEIKIMGHRSAAEFLRVNPKLWDVIFISDPDNKYGISGSYEIAGFAKECCEILFFDVPSPIGGMTPPEREHVQKAIDFAKGRDRLLVCCMMGQSRSSATAYVLKAAEVGPIKALEILNPHVHMPNSVVVRHGSEILGEPHMIDLIRRWKEAAEEAMWDIGPEL